MARPTEAPLPENFFFGGSNITPPEKGIRRYLNELEARVNGGFSAADLPLAPPRDNTSRGSAAVAGQGAIIFNTQDNTLNVSDGTNWRDMSGSIT
jgi:hypothetical protein